MRSGEELVDLPNGLIEDMKAGRVILFLGAGASVGSVDPQGNGPPLGDGLRDLLVSEYLDSRFAGRSLATVAELAMSEKSLPEVQDFIAAKFKNLSPAAFHKIIPSFKWRAIATTNFDLVIEKAYRDRGDRLQDLVPILSNEDRVDEKLRSDRQLAYLKLHGCVTIGHRDDLPLILTIDQYATYRANRDYVFQRFEEWAREYPIVFVGYRVEDVNIRENLLRRSSSIASRPRSFLVTPGVTEVDTRFWESKRVTALQGTLEQFMNALSDRIPASIRPLLKLVEADQPVKKHFIVRHEMPPSIAAMLEHDVEYVHAGMPSESGTPTAFYRGFGLGWYPIRAKLDVRRRLADTLLMDVILRSDEDRPSIAELYVIKAPAGAGKSILLRRVAWEAATEADVISLYARQYSAVSHDDLEELHRVTGKRIFVHWDNAASNVVRIQRLMNYARQKDLPITVIVAERINEWNMSCAALSKFVSDEFELRRLSESEINVLVSLLEEHNCLGPNLRAKNHRERVEEFIKVADRRLLVALHEATRGVPLADILQDEFEGIQPNRAKQLYLTVCVLNRLRTPVRAGLISRVHDIPFEEFRDKLFLPLDHVVEAHSYSGGGDYVYRARHPEIAQIVFTRMLSNVDDRLNEYLRIVGNLNLAFNTDRESFRGLLRAKSLHDLFPDYQHVRAILEKAEEVGSLESYFYQQRANYERIRPDGNLDDAERFIEKARELDPTDNTIRHTLAGVYRARAESAPTLLARQRHRGQARSLLRGLLTARQHDVYARVTLVVLELDDLRDLLGHPDSSDREIDEAIRAADRLITVALQRHPDDEYLLNAEAEFSSLISDHDRSLQALRKASEANRRDPFIANRLARALLKQGDVEGAKDTLWNALEGNRGDMRLNFQYGEILRLSGERDGEALVYYFERAFTPGDRNYEAQFWFARYAFETGDGRLIGKSMDTFGRLRNADLPHRVKVEVRDRVQDAGRDKVFQGTMERMEETFGKVRRDGPGDLIFVHRNQIGKEVWKDCRNGERVCFAIGFAFSGPTAVNLELLGG